MTAPDIAAIEARLAAATPGPWQLDGPFWWRGGDVDPDSASMITASPERGAVCVMPERAYRTNYANADAELIAHAPADIAALLDRVRELETRETRVRELHAGSFDCDAHNGRHCNECGDLFPCATIRVLDGES